VNAQAESPASTQTEAQERGGAELLDQVIAATTGTIDRRESAFMDMQLSTAIKRRRSMKDFLRYATELVSIDEETAASCSYTLPRGGKAIAGPSIRLAEICALAWGNLHTEARIADISDKFIVAAATCWDMENNVRTGQEVRRRITSKNGLRFNDDMIVVTANAAMSIVLRNAIFRIIPKSYVERIRKEAEKVVRGDVKTLKTRRDELLKYFSGLGVNEKRLLSTIQKKGIDDVDLDDLVVLRGYATAIKDKEATVDECFPVTEEGGKDKLTEKVKASGKPKEQEPKTKADGEIVPSDAEVQATRERCQKLALEKGQAIRSLTGGKTLEKLSLEEAADLLTRLEQIPQREPGDE
jgi:hypothetical protein